MSRLKVVMLSLVLYSAGAWAQAPNANATAVPAAAPSAGQLSITVQDAIALAKANNPQYRLAVNNARSAHEDVVQARASLLPGISYTTGLITTQAGPGLAIGAGTTARFIAANATHEYLSQGVAGETISLSMIADYRRTHAAEALARAQAEIAARGVVVTVVQAYYGLIVAARKTANAQSAADEGQRFLTVSQQLEQGGEVAHSDVIKAQLQANELRRILQETRLAEERSRLDLAVLVFPNFVRDYAVIDDLRFAPPLPTISEIEVLAQKNNPALRAALAAMQVASHEVLSAQGGHLPTITANYFYGIDATQYSLRTDGFSNLGYEYTATLNLPIWNWGAIQSKVKQARLRQDQARVELSAAQRQAIADFQSLYHEAELARAQLEALRNSADLAADSLRLTNLRYRAGEATALEVVDAQNTLTMSRNNYDDGEARYRVALANLQTLTGSF